MKSFYLQIFKKDEEVMKQDNGLKIDLLQWPFPFYTRESRITSCWRKEFASSLFWPSCLSETHRLGTLLNYFPSFFLVWFLLEADGLLRGFLLRNRAWCHFSARFCAGYCWSVPRLPFRLPLVAIVYLQGFLRVTLALKVCLNLGAAVDYVDS